MVINGPGAELLVLVVFGALCAMIAVARGRSGVAWFLIGFLFNCIAIVVLLVLPDLKQEGGRQRRLETDNRRLRERVTKDRMVSDRRYAEAHRRISAHDQAIGIDTSDPGDPVAELPPSPPPLPGETADWFYLESTDQRGPVAVSVLRRLWDDRTVGPRTYVWCDGMSDWKEIRDLPDLGEQLGA